MKNSLFIAIMVFVLVAGLSGYIILNKGYIGNHSLVNIGGENSDNGQSQMIMPKLTLEIEKDYLSSKDKKDYSSMIVSIDGEIVTEGVEFSSSNEKID